MVETVIRIEEESHGFLVLVERVKDIVPYLVDMGWINEETTIELLDVKSQWCNIPLKNFFGKDWVKTLSVLPLDVLSEIFDGRFYFSREEVYRAEF